jgi:hypothetical protein
MGPLASSRGIDDLEGSWSLILLLAFWRQSLKERFNKRTVHEAIKDKMWINDICGGYRSGPLVTSFTTGTLFHRSIFIQKKMISISFCWLLMANTRLKLPISASSLDLYNLNLMTGFGKPGHPKNVVFHVHGYP